MVEGRIEFASDDPHLESADLHVWIEDTTYADAPALRVFHQRIPGVGYSGEPDGIPFRLDYTHVPRPARTYSIAVLIDLDGDGKPGRGDYVSVQAVSVPGERQIAHVRVQRIA